MSLEKYFEPFRNNIIGKDQTFDTPFGEKEIIHTYWTASGRMSEDDIYKKLSTSGLRHDTTWLGVDLTNPKLLENMCRKIHDGVGSPSWIIMSRQMLDVKVSLLFYNGMEKHISFCHKRK